MSIEIEAKDPTTTGGVQSLHRALELMEVLAEHGGHLGIGEIATETTIPLPTIHRLLRTLVERGYVRQLPNRRYALGFRLITLGIAANATVGVDVRPVLARLVADLGETANFAMLVDDGAEYVAQVASPHSMRMFTEVGRRVELHSTAVGKALMAGMPPSVVSAIVRRMGLPGNTAHTITTEDALLVELERTAARGYAMDEQEQELGVRCVAVAVPGEFLTPMAVSVSGPATRMTDAVVERAIPLVRTAAEQIAAEVRRTSSSRRRD